MLRLLFWNKRDSDVKQIKLMIYFLKSYFSFFKHYLHFSKKNWNLKVWYVMNILDFSAYARLTDYCRLLQKHTFTTTSSLCDHHFLTSAKLQSPVSTQSGINRFLYLRWVRFKLIFLIQHTCIISNLSPLSKLEGSTENITFTNNPGIYEN